MAKPTPLKIDHIRDQAATAVINAADTEGKEFEISLTPESITTLIGALRKVMNDIAQSGEKIVSSPLLIHHIEFGSFGIGSATMEGIRIYITEALSHDYLFAPGSDQFEKMLDEALKQARGYGLDQIPGGGRKN